MTDDNALYQMPECHGRNIVIFSDGTGQASGLLFDESRSNVYKLFRATRCGPDSAIDPGRQLAFYDPGLGSKLGGDRIKLRWFRKVYNVLSSATGLGISRNIMDCYSALVMLWRPGDRIFLFGFSRGAYTVRCLGGVLGLCGIPTTVKTEKLFFEIRRQLRRLPEKPLSGSMLTGVAQEKTAPRPSTRNKSRSIEKTG